MGNVIIHLLEDLYASKEPIRLLNSEAVTSKVGPSGLGISKHRPPSVKSAAKYSGAAYVLDKLIVDKCANVLDTDLLDNSPTSYTEFIVNGERYRCFFTIDENEGKEDYTLSYELEVPSNTFDNLIPIVAFALSASNQDKECDELKSIFKKIVADYKKNRVAKPEDVLQFCDSFYYTFATKYDNEEGIKVFEKDMADETIIQSYSSKYFEFADFLQDIEGLPEFTILEGMETRGYRTKKKKGKKGASGDADDRLNPDNYHIDYDWSEEQMAKVPDPEYLKGFIPSTHFYSLVNKITLRLGSVLERMGDGREGLDAIQKDYINSFIIGKPGTGKTTIGYALGALLKMPVYTIPITKNTEEDTFQGMTKVVDGKFTFVSTDFLEAYTHGGIILLEEVNLADPSVIMGALGQAVEAPFMLMRDGYKPVKRHPLCIIIGTMNIGTYGSKGVSQAFSSRFKQTYILNDPSKEEFVEILEKQGHEKDRCEWVYNAYQKINNYLKSPEISREEICLNVTLRGCIGALECLDEGDTPQQAIYNSLIGKIAEVDLELADDINKNIVKSLPNLKI